MTDDLVEEAERVMLACGSKLPQGSRWLVGVSGGMDSMVLWRILEEVARRRRWELVAAHFNHQLRGAASDADEEFVRAQAKMKGCQVRVGSARVGELAREGGESIEMAGRRLRREFFKREAVSVGASGVVLAHHLEDQAELVLLRLFRGAGPDGLGGMRERSWLGADRAVALIRPLLGVFKERIGEFAEAHAVEYREDASNAQLDHDRNWVRHELVGRAKERFGSGVVGRMGRTMRLLREEGDWVEEQLEEVGEAGAVEQWERLGAVLQRRWIRRWLVEAGMKPEFALIEGLREGRRVNVGRGWNVRLEGGKVVREAGEEPEEECEFRNESVALDLREGGEARIGRGRLKWGLERGGAEEGWEEKGEGAGVEWFDAEKVGAAVVVRYWRPGDRYQPIGMVGTMKLQDYFVNRKVPLKERRERLVGATADGRIFWVEGERIGERFKLDKETQWRLKWEWQRDGGRGSRE